MVPSQRAPPCLQLLQSLLCLTCFPRKVLKMIDAHKTLIERCSPLAKKVLEMVSMKNLTRHPLPGMRLPVQLLLETLHVLTVDIGEASFKASVRTTEW